MYPCRQAGNWKNAPSLNSEDENLREQNEESHAATNATERRTSQSELTTTTAAAEDGTNVESNAPVNNQNDESNVAPFLGENNKTNS